MTNPPTALADLSPEQLQQATSGTLGHYNNASQSFWEGTRDHDVSQNVAALLRHLPPSTPSTILDFGCGPGRDLITLRDLGHDVVGLVGAERFVEMARAHSGCTVWHQDFLALDLPDEHFDGIFANATLFHVPSQELPRVLDDLRRCLKPEGILFSSNPRGANREGWSGDRYGSYLELATYEAVANAAGFAQLEHYYRPPGQPRHLQPWLASVWRKQELHPGDAQRQSGDPG